LEPPITRGEPVVGAARCICCIISDLAQLIIDSIVCCGSPAAEALLFAALLFAALLFAALLGAVPLC
jgi:hypothetical protein